MTKQNENRPKTFWQNLESAERLPPADELLAHLRFDRDGLIPVVTQCAQTQAVLMLAWMNAPSIAQTLAEGRMVYYSRSRGGLWRKGDTSGCIQQLQELRADCDGDSLLARVIQSGSACHTGRGSCFYNALTPTADD